MKKIILVLIILLFLSISGFCLGEWVSPTSFDDPNSVWNNETSVYDGDTGIGADSYNGNARTWGSFIELNIAEIECTKIRYFADLSDITEIDVDLYYNDIWNDLYEGVFDDQSWEEKEISSLQNVTKARIRFYAKKAATAYLYEFEFSEYSETPLGSVTFQTLTEEIDDTAKEYITMATPPGTQIGDLLVTFIVKDDNEVVDPNGAWIEIVSQGSDAHAVYVAYRIATATDGEWTWIETSGNEDWYGVILRYTGHDANTPIYASDFTIDSVGTNAPIAPSINFTNLTTGSLVIQLFGADTSDTPYTVPAALMPALFNGNVNDCGGAGGDKSASGTGSTGTGIFSTAGSDEWVAVTVIITSPFPVSLGASRFADDSRVDQSGGDNVSLKGTAWEFKDLINMNKDFDLSGIANIQPTDLTFNNDGTKMYVIDRNTEELYEYDLSIAWDTSTAVYADKLLDIVLVGPQRGIYFAPDGMMIFFSDTNEYVTRYNLTEAWDLSTGSWFFMQNFDAQIDYMEGMSFAPDGYKIYLVNVDSGDRRIYEYNLNPAWSLGSKSVAGTHIYGGNFTGPMDIGLRPDTGTRLYVLAPNKIHQYNLSTGWSVSSATYEDYFDVDEMSTHFEVKPDGLRVYVIENINDVIVQYGMVPDWTKTNDIILVTRIYTSGGPIAAAYKLRWRNVTDAGSFADVSDTGEITYLATTDLVDDDDVLIGERISEVQTDYTWQNGLENEGDNLLPNTGTYSLSDEYYTEFHWALDLSGADDEHKYEFELYEVTKGLPVLTVGATVTLAITPALEGILWNTKTITKWNTKAITTPINTQ